MLFVSNDRRPIDAPFVFVAIPAFNKEKQIRFSPKTDISGTLYYVRDTYVRSNVRELNARESNARELNARELNARELNARSTSPQGRLKPDGVQSRRSNNRVPVFEPSEITPAQRTVAMLRRIRASSDALEKSLVSGEDPPPWMIDLVYRTAVSFNTAAKAVQPKKTSSVAARARERRKGTT